MAAYTPLVREEAIKLMFANFTFSPSIETISVRNALNRVTARNVHSVHTLPVHRVSAMDGIAVKSQAFAGGMPDTAAWRAGKEYVFADTGDDFPDEYDTVIKVEAVTFNPDGGVVLADIPVPGQSVKPAGDSLKQGELLIKAHTVINPRNLAVLMAGGIETVDVFRKPKVAFIPTGTELVPPRSRPQRGQNIETNSFMVDSYLAAWGAECIVFPLMVDSETGIENTLKKALDTCDIILVNAGSSKGQEDFTLKILEQSGKVFAHCLKCAPGRPITLAVVDGKPVIGVPGPPIATDCCMRKTVRYFVYHWFGIDPIRATVRATLTNDITASPEMEIFTRVVITKNGDKYTAASGGPNKNLPQTLSFAQGLLTIPIGVGEYKEGEEVEIEID